MTHHKPHHHYNENPYANRSNWKRHHFLILGLFFVIFFGYLFLVFHYAAKPHSAPVKLTPVVPVPVLTIPPVAALVNVTAPVEAKPLPPPSAAVAYSPPHKRKHHRPKTKQVMDPPINVGHGTGNPFTEFYEETISRPNP
jgi:hypothetical protein